MSLFDRTFLISTGVTAVICGALYYYLNTKIRDLEQALVKQNQVLSSFIANVQQEFRGMAIARTNGGRGGANDMTIEIVENSNELASPEALAAVAELDHKKIVITESECDSASEADASEADASEADTDDDDDDDDSASEVDAGEVEINDNKLIIRDLSLNDMKIIDMSSLGISQLDIYTPERQSASEVDASEVDASEAEASEAEASEAEASESESESESDSEEDGFHRVTKIVMGDVNLNALNLLNIEDLSSVSDKNSNTVFNELIPVQVDLSQVELSLPEKVDLSLSAKVESLTETIKTPKYDDLKVDELRKLVLEKGLAQKDEVKKLKKNELLAVLKK